MAAKFKYPPIIEAVLDIDCGFESPFDLKSIESKAKKALAKSYPKMRPIVVQDHRFAQNEYSIKSGLAAFQFLKNDEKQLLQFRTEGFSFNRLAPYSTLDDYLPQIKRNWEIYRKLANPSQIKAIRLRYINRILLPLGAGKIGLDGYLKNAPQTADPKRLELLGFLNQYIAVDMETGNQVHSVITLQPVDDDKLPLIFDNGVVAPMAEDPDNWTQIRKKILELRELKNHVFERTLTKKCLNLF